MRRRLPPPNDFGGNGDLEDNNSPSPSGCGGDGDNDWPAWEDGAWKNDKLEDHWKDNRKARLRNSILIQSCLKVTSSDVAPFATV